MSFLFVLTRFVIRVVFTLLISYEIKGKENIPRSGPLLIVSNHLSIADIPLIGMSVKYPVVYMAKKELFQPWLSGFILRMFGSFPVDREQLDIGALRRSFEVLDRGAVLVMFPEGGRSQGCCLQAGLPGVSLLALRSGCNILPVGITGTEKIKGFAWMLRRPRPNVVANFGQPFRLSVTGRLTKPRLAEATDYIMQHIAELLPREYQGVYRKKEIAA